MMFNPAMLTLARESRGMSRKELSAAANISEGYLSRLERGHVEPTASKLAELAAAVSYPTKFLVYEDRIRGFDSPCLYHRARKTMPKRSLERVEAQMHVTRLQVRWLFDGLDLETSAQMHTLDQEEFGSPEKVAQALRVAWGVGRGPIPNLTELIEYAGGIVYLAEFGHGKLDGLSCWEKNGMPFFYLNQAKPAEVLRFTLAHELGHLTMHHYPSADPEGEADRFAAEFLMPASQIRSQLVNLQFVKLFRLKEYWGVSMKNLITRAARLETVPPSRSRSLYVQLSQKGYITDEPYPIPAEAPTLIDQALRVHVQEQGYSLEELADVLILHEPEVVAKFGVSLPTSRIIKLRRVQDEDELQRI